MVRGREKAAPDESGSARVRRRIVQNLRDLNPIERFFHFFNETLWEERPDRGRLGRFLYPKLRVLTLAFWNLQAHDAATYASALTYTSLLALVPFLAVAFSLFLVFGGLDAVRDRLQDFLLDYIAPGMKAEVKVTIETFMKNVRKGGGSSAILGAVLLIVTTVRTLATLEGTFNRIVGVKRGRPWAARITVYWALATLGPILLGASLAMTATVRSTRFVLWLEDTAPFIVYLYSFAPMLLTCGAFTLLYLFLPNAKMKPRAAAIGGLVAGLVFELAKSGFTAGAVTLVKTQDQVYGSIATLFVGLFWVYISWIIILVGLEVVVAVQSAATHRKEELATQVSQKFKEVIGLRLVAEISLRFHHGSNAPPHVGELSRILDVPERLLRDILDQLEDAALIRTVEGPDEHPAFIPARSLEKISVRDVIAALREHGAVGLSITSDPETSYLLDVVYRADLAAAEVVASEDFRSIAEKIAASAPSESTDRVCDSSADIVRPAPSGGESPATAGVG